MRVGVIDYGVGNVGSVMRALEELSATPILVSTPADMKKVDKLILPGVGNFSDCARLLDEGGWMKALPEEVLANNKPLLGICLGMQLLATLGTEGATKEMDDGMPGLDLIPGRIESLKTLGSSLRIPHVGWNEVTYHDAGNSLFSGIPELTDFYFVHSYAFVPINPDHVLAKTSYGIPVVAAVRSGNVYGTQFHPEKSSRAGFQLLDNFIKSPVC